MGEDEGGGGQDEDLLVPPPLHPLPCAGRGNFWMNMSNQLWTPQ